MDYYQGVVLDYLQADRAVFVNAECVIQLNEGEPNASGTHWICDAVAVDMRRSQVLLCEVTYAKQLGALQRRLTEWAQKWQRVMEAVRRDCKVDPMWEVRPWVFVPAHLGAALETVLDRVARHNDASAPMPRPGTTFLEETAPWRYTNWDRSRDAERASGSATPGA